MGLLCNFVNVLFFPLGLASLILIIIIIIIIVRQILCEKYLANEKDVFWACKDLEKAYDQIDWHGMWQMLRVYGVTGKLLKALQNLYEFIW